MDDPMMLVLLAALVVALVGLVLVKKKQQQPSSNKKTSASKSKKTTKSHSSAKESSGKSEPSSSKQQSGNENWDWSAASNMVDGTKVSVQDVDTLTEFNVYKQFGYHEKAAESLANYLDKTQKADGPLVNELLSLWIEAKNPDAVAETLAKYQQFVTKQQAETFIKSALSFDENHLPLRVLAESILGWSVKKTAEEIGEKNIADAPAMSKKQGMPKPRSRQQQQDEAAVRKALARKILVSGQGTVKAISNDEKGAVLAFMKPEQSVKLLKNSLTYDAATKYLNKAIQNSEKPASLLIDALTLDYKANNINGFAGHLWKLYYSLGQYGRQVKERMLGWGYSLGHHPVFDQLEANPSESALRELGMQQGWIDGGTLKKARYQALVSEISGVDAEPRTPVERILKEADSLLMYGQLENSMDLLEHAIVEYPQESQLYITLFDLYERAEEWERLEGLLQRLRSQVKSLPEEVVLAMSQLLQRFNNGSFGH